MKDAEDTNDQIKPLILNYKTFSTPNSPVYIGETVLKDNKCTTAHSHDFYEFFFVTEGKLLHYLNDNIYTMEEKSAQFIFPEDTHFFQKHHSCNNTILINIAFPRNLLVGEMIFLNNYFIQGNRKKELQLIGIQENLWTLAMEKIFRISQSNAYHKKLVIFQSLLLDVLTEFLKYEDNEKDNIPFWLSHARTEMEKKENFTVGLQRFIQLSRKSQEHLTRQMKKYYKITPTNYINDLRLQEAAKLLLYTEYPILDIIYACGFNNVSYFIELFKRKFNVTPNDYRNKNKLIFSKI